MMGSHDSVVSVLSAPYADKARNSGDKSAHRCLLSPVRALVTRATCSRYLAAPIKRSYCFRMVQIAGLALAHEVQGGRICARGAGSSSCCLEMAWCFVASVHRLCDRYKQRFVGRGYGTTTKYALWSTTGLGYSPLPSRQKWRVAQIGIMRITALITFLPRKSSSSFRNWEWGLGAPPSTTLSFASISRIFWQGTHSTLHARCFREWSQPSLPPPLP